MALEIDPSRSMVLRTRGELMHPACCKVCGGSDPDRTYMDFGIFLDYEGTIYICIICMSEAAEQVMGFFSPEQHLALLALNNTMAERILALEAELEKYGPLMDVLRGLNVPVDRIISGGDDSGSGSPESNEKGEGELRERSDEGKTGTPEVTELPDSEGRSDSDRAKSSNRSKPVIT